MTGSSRPSPIAAVLFDLDDTLLDRRATVDRYLIGLPIRGLVPPTLGDAFRARFHELDACGYSDRRAMFGQVADRMVAFVCARRYSMITESRLA